MRHRLLGFTLLALSAAGVAQAQAPQMTHRSQSRQPAAVGPMTAGPAYQQSPAHQQGSAYGDMPVYNDASQGFGCAECSDCGGCDSCCVTGAGCAPRFYAQADVLLWWTKESNLPPLATTSTDPADQGVLGEPTTVVLIGNESINDDLRVGGRINFGYWLDDCELHALELNFFGLGEEDTRLFEESDGTTVLTRPFFNVDTGAQGGQLLAFPGLLAGSIEVLSDTQVLGSELNFRQAWGRGSCSRSDLIVGYRFARLDENLRINDQFAVIDPLDPDFGTVFNGSDRFETDNEFHGGNIGLMYEVRCQKWTWTLLGKVALGNMHQEVFIDGTTTVTAGGVSTVQDQGLLALDSNIGSYDRDKFAVIPEMGVTFGYHLAPRLKATVGYTFIYFSNVVRPEDQIDLAIDPSQLTGGTGTSPEFQFNDTDYWMQGLNLGLEYTF